MALSVLHCEKCEKEQPFEFMYSGKYFFDDSEYRVFSCYSCKTERVFHGGELEKELKHGYRVSVRTAE